MKGSLLIILSTLAATLVQPVPIRGGASTQHTNILVDDCPYKYCGGYVVYRKAKLYRRLADGLQHKRPVHTVRSGDRVFVAAEIRGKEDWLRVARYAFVEGSVPRPTAIPRFTICP